MMKRKPLNGEKAANQCGVSQMYVADEEIYF